MENAAHHIRIFISSPGDVNPEREALRKLIVEDLQANLGQYYGLYLEPIMWETHGHPVFGPIQENLFKQLGTFHIFLGLFWTRFGTPSGEYDSGSEAEFRRAYALWEQDQKLPIMMYFCMRPIPKGSDLDQAKKVEAFQQEIQGQGLIWEYEEVQELVDLARRHLTAKIRALLPADTQPTVPQNPQDRATPIGRLFYYMVNRTNTCFQINQAVKTQRSSPDAPVVCIIHGDSEQCLDKLVERLSKEELHKSYHLHKTATVSEIRFQWPNPPRTGSEFHDQLTHQISRYIHDNVHETDDIKAHINKLDTPVLFSSSVPASALQKHNPGQLISDFLSYWSQLRPLGQRVVVVLAVSYKRRDEDNYGWLKSLLNRREKQESSSQESVQHLLESLSRDAFDNIILTVPEKLPNVMPEDIETWAFAEKLTFTDEDLRILFQSPEELEQGVPMQTIVDRLESLLEPAHV